MKQLFPLIRQLSDGKFHSGVTLAKQFAVSRTAIWKRVQKINQIPGLEVFAISGKGYRLAESLELLEVSQLTALLDDKGLAAIEKLWILPEIDSTNNFLMARPIPQLNNGMVCFTEHQFAGKGRRGRQWSSAYGQSLTFSLAWNFDLPLGALSGLSIATGVLLAEVLSTLGLQEHCLKWPNDIHIEGKKLAGILVEAGGEMSAPSRAVIGIGINLGQQQNVDQPWTGLKGFLTTDVGRNQLAGLLLQGLTEMCQLYQTKGLEPFLPRWKQYDRYLGKKVSLSMADKTIHGQYTGLNAQGGLLLDTAEGRTAYYAGEVSMRT